MTKETKAKLVTPEDITAALKDIEQREEQLAEAVIDLNVKESNIEAMEVKDETTPLLQTMIKLVFRLGIDGTIICSRSGNNLVFGGKHMLINDGKKMCLMTIKGGKEIDFLKPISKGELEETLEFLNKYLWF